jgi:hypothetical protein
VALTCEIENSYIISGCKSHGTKYSEQKYVSGRITLNWISSKKNVCGLDPSGSAESPVEMRCENLLRKASAYAISD